MTGIDALVSAVFGVDAGQIDVGLFRHQDDGLGHFQPASLEAVTGLFTGHKSTLYAPRLIEEIIYRLL